MGDALDPLAQGAAAVGQRRILGRFHPLRLGEGGGVEVWVCRHFRAPHLQARSAGDGQHEVHGEMPAVDFPPVVVSDFKRHVAVIQIVLHGGQLADAAGFAVNMQGDRVNRILND